MITTIAIISTFFSIYFCIENVKTNMKNKELHFEKDLIELHLYEYVKRYNPEILLDEYKNKQNKK